MTEVDFVDSYVKFCEANDIDFDIDANEYGVSLSAYGKVVAYVRRNLFGCQTEYKTLCLTLDWAKQCAEGMKENEKLTHN